jgi:hypothetical protein
VLANSSCDQVSNFTSSDGANDHICRYDITTGFGFDVLYLDEVVIEVNSAAANDVAYNNAGWGANACVFREDVRFGTPNVAPAVSLGNFLGLGTCSPVTSYLGGNQLTWNEAETAASSATTLRLEFNGAGGDDEGWIWVSGCVYVRDAPDPT